MRFISMVKSAEAKAVPPSKEFLEAMDQLTQDAAKAGCVMVEGRDCFRLRRVPASDLPMAK